MPNGLSVHNPQVNGQDDFTSRDDKRRRGSDRSRSFEGIRIGIYWAPVCRLEEAPFHVETTIYELKLQKGFHTVTNVESQGKPKRIELEVRKSFERFMVGAPSGSMVFFFFLSTSCSGVLRHSPDVPNKNSSEFGRLASLAMKPFGCG